MFRLENREVQKVFVVNLAGNGAVEFPVGRIPIGTCGDIGEQVNKINLPELDTHIPSTLSESVSITSFWSSSLHLPIRMFDRTTELIYSTMSFFCPVSS